MEEAIPRRTHERRAKKRTRSAKEQEVSVHVFIHTMAYLVSFECGRFVRICRLRIFHHLLVIDAVIFVISFCIVAKTYPFERCVLFLPQWP